MTETTKGTSEGPRPAHTYRAARRAIAKRLRTFAAGKGKTIRELMPEAPFQQGNAILLQPVTYRQAKRASNRVWTGGDYPGSTRRKLIAAQMAAMRSEAATPARLALFAFFDRHHLTAEQQRAAVLNLARLAKIEADRAAAEAVKSE